MPFVPVTAMVMVVGPSELHELENRGKGPAIPERHRGNATTLLKVVDPVSNASN